MSRTRQGEPGVVCSAGMNPSLIQRCTVEATTPSSRAASATLTGSRVGWFGAGLVAGDLPVGAKAGHDRGGERLSAGAGAALPVEDPGDSRVGVVNGQTAHQLDGVLAGADLRRRLSGQGDGEFGQSAATPAQR